MDRKEQNRLEIEAGRLRVFKDMADGIMAKYQAEYKFEKLVIKNNSPDPRTWTIDVYVPGSPEPVVENFWDFPTSGLLASMIFLNEVKR